MDAIRVTYSHSLGGGRFASNGDVLRIPGEVSLAHATHVVRIGWAVPVEPEPETPPDPPPPAPPAPIATREPHPGSTPINRDPAIGRRGRK